MTVIHWFRKDLRLQDNLALHAALKSGQLVIPLFIFDDSIYHSQRAGAPRMQFWLNALQSLDQSLQRYGSRLWIKHGQPLNVLHELIAENSVSALYFNKDYTPYANKRDTKIEQALNIAVHTFDDAIILPVNRVLKDDGTPYKVFTPYKTMWNKIQKPVASEFDIPHGAFLATETPPNIPTLTDLGYPPQTIELPPATEQYAHDLLSEFLRKDLHHYSDTRNHLPSQPFAQARPTGTSYLSPYLRVGLISARSCYWLAREVYAYTPSIAYRESIETWVSELTWREFYNAIMSHFPHVLKRDFVDTYTALEWRDDPDELEAWKHGNTGYPIVDAPMRQLQAIGWMPNRARMIVASFLTKHLLIHWLHGDKHFMKHLIDGDLASNNGGWQWSAGTGTDAQPYFRIFNPITQSQKFATPEYLRYWLPELQAVPEKFIHTPWLAPNPPKRYPLPIVEHDFARQRTLNAFKIARGELER
jgi:deoxyribodipyrimidine photo-lyase